MAKDRNPPAKAPAKPAEFVAAPRPYRRVAVIAALVAAALGAPAWFATGWMPPLVGAGLICAGGSLALFAAWPRDKQARLLSMLAAVAVAMYAGAFVLQSIIGGKLDVEAIMGPVPLGTISPVITVALLATGLALLWLQFSTEDFPHGGAGAGGLGVALAGLGLGVLLGHAYGLSWLASAVLPIGAPSALGLIALGLGLAAVAGPRQAPLSALCGPAARARLLRALAAAVVGALVVQSLLYRYLGPRLNPVDAPLWSALSVATLIGLAAAPLLARLGVTPAEEPAPVTDTPHGADDERLRGIVAQLPLYVWTTDRDLRITAVHGGSVAPDDPRLGRWMGRTIQELSRSRRPDDPPLAAHLRALRGEPGRYEYAYEGRQMDCRVVPLRDTTGAVVGCLGLALNIAEQLPGD